MQISKSNIERTCPESDIYNELLALDNSYILELGCGKAELTRLIATSGHQRRIMALEVDQVQHAKNLQITDLPNVEFKLAGAENIPAADNTFDIVMMFKSLHHVPTELMRQGLQEIYRVLKPGGYLYISEPIFAGEFNEILRLFHDEQSVREAAFQAEQQTVNDNVFKLSKQVFFNAPMRFENFTEFENNVINVTHSDHRLTDDIYAEVKNRFMNHQTEEGAFFSMPIRVDLLRKAG